MKCYLFSLGKRNRCSRAQPPLCPGVTTLIVGPSVTSWGDKEMATHSSILAWRIPGTEEPGGLPSVGSHRVGLYWSNLAVAAAVTSRTGVDRKEAGSGKIRIWSSDSRPSAKFSSAWQAECGSDTNITVCREGLASLFFQLLPLWRPAVHHFPVHSPTPTPTPVTPHTALRDFLLAQRQPCCSWPCAFVY